MSVTVRKKGNCRVFEGNGLKMKHVTIDLGEYATNGVPVADSDFGMEQVLGFFHQEPLTTNIKTLVYDAASKKIIAYSDWAATQVVNTTDLTGELVHAVVVGV